MSALHLVTLAVLSVATVWSLLLLVRNREPRVGLLTLLFALLLGIEAVALESQWGAPLAANAATAGAVGALGIAVLGLLVVGALADMAVREPESFSNLVTVAGGKAPG